MDRVFDDLIGLQWVRPRRNWRAAAAAWAIRWPETWRSA